MRRENDEWEMISSEDLVPGDVILIPPGGCEMTCDAVLFSGTAIGMISILIERRQTIVVYLHTHLGFNSAKTVHAFLFSQRVYVDGGICSSFKNVIAEKPFNQPH